MNDLLGGPPGSEVWSWSSVLGSVAVRFITRLYPFSNVQTGSKRQVYYGTAEADLLPASLLAFIDPLLEEEELLARIYLV